MWTQVEELRVTFEPLKLNFKDEKLMKVHPSNPSTKAQIKVFVLVLLHFSLLAITFVIEGVVSNLYYI